MKECVQIIILNEDNQVLAVSRKDNHSDFGLPGGKVDPEDVNCIEAIIREVKEETGLTVYEKDLTQIFSMHRDEYMGYTYLCSRKLHGPIETDEPHVVKWSNYQEVKDGSFGYWNTLVYESLVSMGIKIKNND